MTVDEYRRVLAKTGGVWTDGEVPILTAPKKYRNVPVEVDGFKFDSKGEATRYGELKLRVLAGEISDLEVHPIVPIIVNDIPISECELDFRYIHNGKIVWEDFKGHDTAISKLKRALVEAIYQRPVNIIRKRR